MKKLIFLICFVFSIYTLLLVAGTLFGDEERTANAYEYECGIDGPMYLRESRTIYPTMKECILNASTAAKAATIIFNGLLEDFAEYSDYIAQTVCYDEDDGIWVVKFWPWWKWNDPIHEDWCIALKQSNGEVIAIWVEE